MYGEQNVGLDVGESTFSFFLYQFVRVFCNIIEAKNWGFNECFPFFGLIAEYPNKLVYKRWLANLTFCSPYIIYVIAERTLSTYT